MHWPLPGTKEKFKNLTAQEGRSPHKSIKLNKIPNKKAKRLIYNQDSKLKEASYRRTPGMSQGFLR